MWDAMFSKATARARLTRDGRLEIATAASDIGTGTYTILAQIASETLGIPLDRIDVKIGDSDLPYSRSRAAPGWRHPAARRYSSPAAISAKSF